MKAKLFHTNGRRTFRRGVATKRMFSASFSFGKHSLARRDGMVNIQIDHILGIGGQVRKFDSLRLLASI